jgi:hypothetical protein
MFLAHDGGRTRRSRWVARVSASIAPSRWPRYVQQELAQTPAAPSALCCSPDRCRSPRPSEGLARRAMVRRILARLSPPASALVARGRPIELPRRPAHGVRSVGASTRTTLSREFASRPFLCVRILACDGRRGDTHTVRSVRQADGSRRGRRPLLRRERRGGPGRHASHRSLGHTSRGMCVTA